MRRSVLLVLVSIAMSVLAGCETVKGVGRDITGASDFVQHGMSSSPRNR